MGSVSKYKTKDMVYVSALIPSTGDPPVAGEPVKYGFPTNIPAADRATLGHVALDYATPPTKLIIGCSFPKPYRASMRQALRYTSSYCSKDKIAALKGAGWRVSPSKARSRIILGDKPFVKTVYVKIVGINYAWQLPKVTETSAGGPLTELGIVDATAADADDLVFGANFPKPPRATKEVGTSGTDTYRKISTYYDPDKTTAAGWSFKGGGRLKL